MSGSLVEKKLVVVVGGGVGGAHAAKYLQNFADVTLVDPKDHFEIPYAGLRSIVQPEFAERSLILHSEYLKTAKHVVSSGENILEKELVTSSGEKLPFDFLVIATGSVHTGSITKPERIKHFQSEHMKIKNSNTILIIGGGPVGVELAGEIVVDFPEKKVILVHSGDRLIEFLGPATSKKALKWLKSQNVEVHLKERIDIKGLSETTTEYTTSSGKQIKADCHFVCVGRRLGNSWLKETVLKEKLDENGRLKVDEHLRVEEKANIFACGDITSIAEIKQGYLAEKHARIIAQNIKKLCKNPNAKLSKYKPMTSPIGMVSLGRNVGVAQLPLFGAVGGCIVGQIKSKDLFVGSTRKALGLKGS